MNGVHQGLTFGMRTALLQVFTKAINCRLWTHQSVRSAGWRRRGTSVTCAEPSPRTMTTIMAAVRSTAWPNAKVAAKPRPSAPANLPETFSEKTLIMVVTNHKTKVDFYECAECGMRYVDKEWAEKCKAWCSEHHTCNIEIIQHAVKNEIVQS